MISNKSNFGQRPKTKPRHFVSNFVRSLFVFFSILLASQAFMAPVSEAAGRRIIYKPHDMKNVDFYIMTVGLGPEIYMRYGHTILKLVNHERGGAEYNFNWGVFDFNDSDFAYNYFKGKQIYRMGSSSNESIISMYRDDEKRKVWKEKLNLTNRQKETLVERIFWNLKAENRTYNYQHFYNNCSTKLRDYIDEAIGGKLKLAYKDKISTWNFRDYVTINLSQPALVGFGLDIVMNRKIDGTITNWEEMFYPEKLREMLMKLPQYDDYGNAIPGTSLLSDSSILVEGNTFPPPRTNVFKYILILLGLPLLFVLINLAKNSLSSSQEDPKSFQKFSIRLLGLLVCFWAGGAWFFGSLMAVSWAFSGHLDILHNANLWVFWPVDGFFAFTGLKLLRSGAPANGTTIFGRLIRYLALAHLLAAGIYLLLYVGGIFEQNINNIVVYLVPLAGMLYVAIYRYGFTFVAVEKLDD